MDAPRLKELSLQFAVEIISLVKRLKAEREYIISEQIGRSGTSIGANIREANYAQSKPDFISKLQIALKEANETGYWLELLQKTGYLSTTEYTRLETACAELRIKLIRSINTAKGNLKS